ncbi:hypothetical protein IAT38_000702 [Cryptococcus sp. DSM 104549]
MAAEHEPLNAPIPEQLEQVAHQLEQKPWALATDTGDEALAEKALAAAKQIFDLGISLEAISHPHLHPFLLSILEPPTVNLRSSKGKAAAPPPPPTDPETFLPYTPLVELTTDGLDPEQVWAQLELRTEGITKVIKEVGSNDRDEEDDDEKGDLEDSDEDMTVEEFRQMLMESGEEGVENLTDEEIQMLMDMSDSEGSEDDEEGSEEDSEEHSEEESDEEEGIKFRDDSEELSMGSDEGEEDDEEDDDEEDEEDDDEDVEMGSDDEELDEDEEDEEDDGENTEEVDGAESDDDEAALLGIGSSKPRKGRHPTLDDQFFSIDQFNKETEELEAGRLTSGALGGDEDDDEDLADVSNFMLEGAGDDEEITYADFFEPPRGSAKPSSKKDKGKGKSKGKDKAKVKKARFDDEDDLMEEDEEDEEEDEARGVMGRVKGDLFEDEDEDEDEQEERVLSNHEKRQRALALEIAELEGEAVGPKDWTLLGEATSRARPENSLLEENLDFEQVGKVVPVITEDSVKTLEELIKARILDNNFNSPVRVRAYEPTAFLPSRFFELQDTQSSKSLAQIYEEEYQAAADGGKVKDPRDEKLKKEHEAIDQLWGEICYKLDALSSLNFVPKQPKSQITTISDLPTTTMESALPPTASTSTMLAPQELFAAPSASSLVARSELTPEEAQRQRNKHRKQKKADRQKLGDMAELYGKKKKSAKEEKEEALKGLVKTGKGVTVVGKGAKEAGKASKRGAEESATQGGKRLKL